MKRLFLLLTLSAAVLCASASNKYVKADGSDSNDGSSWANARATIAAAMSSRVAGDTVFVAEGVYNENLAAKDGVAILGGYNAETGVRDPEMYESILDGTGSTSWILVKYDGDPEKRIVLDGLVFANANHNTWGGAAMFIRGNMTVNNCIFRNCISGSKAGGIYVDQANSGSEQTIISNCLFEECGNTAADNATAINLDEEDGSYNVLVEDCIIRNCTGDVMIYSRAGMTVRNCVIYNNHSSKNGCLYGGGTFINNTVCNNTGVDKRYAGARVTGKVINTVFWGNTAPNAPNVNYVASGNATNCIADAGTGITLGLAAENNAADGPNFRNPTGFAGIAKTDAEKTAVKKADFSLTAASAPLLDKADATQAPAKDITGLARPKGAGYDIGAYEYDPDAVVIAVTGVKMLQESVEIIEGYTATLVAQVEPENANNKRVNWSIEDKNIATISNGKVTAVKEGTTTAWVETEDGGYKASATVIVKPVPPIKYPKEVVEADEMYKIEDYTIPSFIPFSVAKTEAKIDSMNPDADLTVIPAKIAVMQERIGELVSKEYPYNQIATINGDPATHMGFCWFTNGGITEGKVQLVAKANATETDFAGAGVITVDADVLDARLHYTPIQSSENPKYDICTAAGLPRDTWFDYVSHKALATNLQPGTTYSWRVGYDTYWSEIGQFVTKDAEQGNFSFVYMTDSHIQDAEYIEQAARCAKAVAKNEKDAKFCLFPGDFVDTGGDTNSEWQWERWFEGSMRPMLNSMAVVPTDGNHDDSKLLNYDYHFNTDWGFANAAETKPQFKGITYSFQYGDVLFLVFSMQDWWRAPGTSEEGMTSPYFTHDLKNWFDEQIAKYPTAKYRVTLSHKNVFSGAGHHTDDECTLLRACMLPIMKECGIDLAIQGHDHCYEVIGPVDPDTRKVVPGSVTDTIHAMPEATGRWERSSNKTGIEGGTFTTDNGTLYFIGATCGRKRYEPHNRALMEEEYTEDPELLFDYSHHNVKDLFDLFTSKFGQPGSPSYSRFNVTPEYLEIVTYYLDANDNPQVFNTIRVKNSRPSTAPQGFESIMTDNTKQSQKFLYDGQVYIQKNGVVYNVIGQRIAQ